MEYQFRKILPVTTLVLVWYFLCIIRCRFACAANGGYYLKYQLLPAGTGLIQVKTCRYVNLILGIYIVQIDVVHILKY